MRGQGSEVSQLCSESHRSSSELISNRTFSTKYGAKLLRPQRFWKQKTPKVYLKTCVQISSLFPRVKKSNILR